MPWTRNQMAERAARVGAGPRSSSGRAVMDAQQRADGELEAALKPRAARATRTCGGGPDVP